MSGGGIGGAVGTGLGLALAPETGGLSLAIPAAGGALGAGLGGELTGSKDPLKQALIGGVMGGLGGAAFGGSDMAGLFTDPAAGAEAADTAALGAAYGPVPEGAAASGMGSGIPASGLPSLGDNAGSAAGNAATGNTTIAGMTPAPDVTPQAPASFLSRLENSAANNPLNAALAGTTGLSAIQALLPKPKVNIGQNASNVLSTNPQFNNPNLPQYSMQNTATPYTGNWYTYGQTPQAPLYNAQPVPVTAAHGGLIKNYAHGGQVRRYAPGGQVMPMGAPPMAPQNPLAAAMPPQMSPQGMPPRPMMPPQGKPPVNPLMLKAAHEVGLAIGEHIKRKRMAASHTPDGQVHGKGGGQDDAIPARLSQGEFVVPADVVSHLGDGSSNHGAKKLTQMMHKVRADKAGKGFPKKAKNPLSYIKGA